MRPPPWRTTLGVAGKGMRVPLQGGPGLLTPVAGGGRSQATAGCIALPCGPENLSIQAPSMPRSAVRAPFFMGWTARWRSGRTGWHRTAPTTGLPAWHRRIACPPLACVPSAWCPAWF